MQKGSAAILLLLLGVLVVVSGIYFSFKSPNVLQSPGEMQTTKSSQNKYTDPNLGFEFDAQDGLTVKQDSEEEFDKRGNGNFRKNFNGYIGYEPGEFIGAVAVLDKSGSFDQNPFTVWVFDNPDNLSIESWHGKYWYYPFVWGDFTQTGKKLLAPKEEATISGQMTKSAVLDYQPGKPKFIYLAKDKKMYLFRIIGEIGNKLLSSFKFLQ